MHKTFGTNVYNFLSELKLSVSLPQEIETINPLESPDARKYAGQFYEKFFHDNNKRTFVIGINPGRFGSAFTGVNFTDPVALEEDCGIKNDLIKKRELSSQFIYSFIRTWGGAEKFYNSFYMTALSPIGFTKNGLNYNYYDSKELLELTLPFIKQTLQTQTSFGATSKAVLIGTGKNLKYFSQINEELGLFDAVYPVEHPRYIMQYKRKSLDLYLDRYYQAFSSALK